jgi:AraC family transcriptional regulator
MKTTQRRRYAERIDRVLGHLEALPAESAPSLEELARVATMSEFHFHRVFRLMTGETLGDALRRIRLARAVPALAANAPVEEAAAQSGYAARQSFARALRSGAGVSPVAARRDPDALANALRQARPGPRAGGVVPALTIDIASVQPLRLLAIRNVGAYQDLNAAYGRLFEQVTAQLSPESIVGLYGVQFDDPRVTPPHECRAICAFDVGSGAVAAGDLEELTLPGGDFLRIHHQGSYDLIHDSIDVLYAHAIDALERELAPQPPYIHFLDDPDQVAEADLRADVYLPLR